MGEDLGFRRRGHGRSAADPARPQDGFHQVAPTSDQVGLYLLALQLRLTRSIEGAGEATAVIVQPKAEVPVTEAIWTLLSSARCATG